MKIRLILKQRRLFVTLCLAVLCALAGLAHASTQDPGGPAIGETIDLKSFQSRSGQTLFEAMKQHSIAMLLFVDPNCGECTNLKDSLRALRENVEKTRIAYYIVMIPDGSDPQKYFAFAESLKLDTESFIWNNSDAKPVSLVLMTKPAHLQITNEGLLIQKWSGIPQNRSTP